MDIALALIWMLAMVVYSFASDYVLRFPKHNMPALPFIRWGALLVAMGLSFYLSKAYKSLFQGTGIWIFFALVFVIVALSKVTFIWLMNRKR